MTFPIDDSGPEVLGDGVERGFFRMGGHIILRGLGKVLGVFLEGRIDIGREALCRSGMLQAVGGSVLGRGVGTGGAWGARCSGIQHSRLDDRESFDDLGSGHGAWRAFARQLYGNDACEWLARVGRSSYCRKFRADLYGRGDDITGTLTLV